MADTIGQAEILTDYPIVSGLSGANYKQTGRREKLMPTEGSLVLQKLKKGMS